MIEYNTIEYMVLPRPLLYFYFVFGVV